MAGSGQFRGEVGAGDPGLGPSALTVAGGPRARLSALSCFSDPCWCVPVLDFGVFPLVWGLPGVLRTELADSSVVHGAR